MINEEIAKSMLTEFDGCDSDNPGSPDYPAVWLFGIEPGYSKIAQDTEKTRSATTPAKILDDNYSIEAQLEYRPFNPKAFKLLAAINGYPVEQFREFARLHQPFVRGLKDAFKSNIYFKGNLYPYACYQVSDWPEDAQLETGISDKEEYRQWCQKYRFPVIKQWVNKYQPKVFIGVGITCRNEFSLAAFGKIVEFKEEIIIVNSHIKKIFYFIDEKIKLVVVPHFSGPYGLNSNKSLQEAGSFVNSIIASKL